MKLMKQDEFNQEVTSKEVKEAAWVLSKFVIKLKGYKTDMRITIPTNEQGRTFFMVMHVSVKRAYCKQDGRLTWTTHYNMPKVAQWLESKWWDLYDWILKKGGKQ